MSLRRVTTQRDSGVNIEGLKRRGFSREAITAIRNAYKLIYRSGKTLDEVKPEIAELGETFRK